MKRKVGSKIGEEGGWANESDDAAVSDLGTDLNDTYMNNNLINYREVIYEG